LVDVILAIDIGTTQTKAALVSTKNHQILCTAVEPNHLEFPRPRYVEQDPRAIWQSIMRASKGVVSQSEAASAKVVGLTFCAQMTGIVPLDTAGKPLTNFLTWLDSRAAPLVPNMFPGLIHMKGYGLWRLLKFLRITGGAPSFAGKDVISKHFWLKEEQPAIYRRAAKIIDTKDYAIFKTTGNYVTSTDLAAITWLMDVRPGHDCWSKDIFALLHLDIAKMPEIQATTAVVGNLLPVAAKELGLPQGIPVVNGTGDIMAAAIGSGAIHDGDLHASVGTAGWVACHCPERCKDLGAYTGTVCSANSDRYLILCKQETSGGALEWVKNILYPQTSEPVWKIIDEQVASTPPGSAGLFFMPWLAGERAPIDNHSIRGMFFNLGLQHTRAHLLRATYEGIALNLRWALDAVEKVRAKKLKGTAKTLRLVGGGARSDVWSQILADALNKVVERVHRPQDVGTHGVALTAMVGLQILPSFNSIIPLIHVDRIFRPKADQVQLYASQFQQFKAIYASNKSLHARLNA
jgi:xylulokinase